MGAIGRNSFGFGHALFFCSNLVTDYQFEYAKLGSNFLNHVCRNVLDGD
jgi:hypothetical protein